MDYSIFRSEVTDVYTTTSSIAISSCKLLTCLKDVFYAISRGLNDIAVTVSNSSVSNSPTCKDSAPKQELLILYKLLDKNITSADSIKPFLKALIIHLIFLMPDV